MTQLGLLPHDGRTRAVSTDEVHDVYAGRSRTPPAFAEIGAPGWLGNPYDVRVYGAEAGPLFERYFLARAKRDREFRTAVLALAGKRLGCPGCATGSPGCHARFIAQWIETNRGGR